MQSLGQKFRAAREARGLSLERIAADTRISPVYLRALEEDNLGVFPAPVFYRGFLRQYAKYLGLPESSVNADIQRSLTEEQTTSAPVLPPLSDAKRYDVPPMPTGAPRVRDEIKRWSVRVAGLALVVLGCAGVYEASLKWPANGLRRPEWLSWATAKPAPSPPAAPAPQAQPAAPMSVPLKTASTNGVQLELRAREVTWVEAFSGPSRIFSGILQPGESKTLESADRIRVLIGNAGGLEIRHNGRPLPPPGERGQVMTLDFTLSDHVVVPIIPKPQTD